MERGSLLLYLVASAWSVALATRASYFGVDSAGKVGRLYPLPPHGGDVIAPPAACVHFIAQRAASWPQLAVSDVRPRVAWLDSLTAALSG